MRIRYRLAQLRWQLALCTIVTAGLALYLWHFEATHSSIEGLNRETFVASVAAVASILALFCSISIAFVLFVSQSARAERIAAFDQFKSRLLSTQQWLLSQPKNPDREQCLSLVFELDKLDLSDLPQTREGAEYKAYAKALEKGLDGPDVERREFFLTSVLYIGYIEQLLNRIGLVSIRQIISKSFIDTLAKGVVVICLSVAVLLASSVWYSDRTKLGFVVAGTFCGLFAVLLFYEFCNDLYRYYDEELDFVEQDSRDSAI
jgi:hypothetical protein